MRDIVKAFRRPRRFARATGTAASQGFRAASHKAFDAPHRRTMCSLPKTLGSRLYESLSTLLGIRRSRIKAGLAALLRRDGYASLAKAVGADRR